MKKIYKLVLLN